MFSGQSHLGCIFEYIASVLDRYARCIATALISLIGRLDFTRGDQAAGK